MNNPKRILIADDHYVVILGTALILESNLPDIQIEYAEDFNEVKEKLHNSTFDLILLDIDMPGSTSKFMIKEIKAIQKDLLIMIFTSYKYDHALQYIEEGANCFLNKLCSEQVLVQAVKSLFSEGSYFTPEIFSLLANKEKTRTEIDHLSQREFQVFKLLAEGNGNLEVANILEIEVPTASTYKKRIYKKLRIKNIVELLNIYNKYFNK